MNIIDAGEGNAPSRTFVAYKPKTSASYLSGSEFFYYKGFWLATRALGFGTSEDSIYCCYSFTVDYNNKIDYPEEAIFWIKSDWFERE